MFSGYYNYINDSPFDRFILCLGFLVAFVQTFLFVGYILKIATLERTAIKWLDWVSMFFELFPLLGLLGTVVSLLNTFKEVKLNADTDFDIGSMLGDFAPALTSTVSGIIALIMNLLVFIFIIRIIAFIEEGEVRR